VNLRSVTVSMLYGSPVQKVFTLIQRYVFVRVVSKPLLPWPLLPDAIRMPSCPLCSHPTGAHSAGGGRYGSSRDENERLRRVGLLRTLAGRFEGCRVRSGSRLPLAKLPKALGLPVVPYARHSAHATPNVSWWHRFLRPARPIKIHVCPVWHAPSLAKKRLLVGLAWRAPRQMGDTRRRYRHQK
jgi:hypothetical protein